MKNINTLFGIGLTALTACEFKCSYEQRNPRQVDHEYEFQNNLCETYGQGCVVETYDPHLFGPVHPDDEKSEISHWSRGTYEP